MHSTKAQKDMPLQDRDKRVIELRKQGLSYSQVACELGLTRGQVGRSLIRSGVNKETPRSYKVKYPGRQHDRGAEWTGWSEHRLTEPWHEYAARKRRERQEARHVRND